MAITDEDKEYVALLKPLIEDTEMVVAVALLTRTSERRKQMYDFIRSNPQARNEEILKKAVEIHRQET